MKILVCCGSGLGSSFMIQMNVEKVLKELKVEAEVDHADLSSAMGMKADIYLGTRDITSQFNSLGGEIVSLNSMLDMNELRTKLEQALKKLGKF
ncbi:PTS sugar transporter subunit IIB [Desnuesiella massiliensis]|uniref:PTS sugar transporter subunit IIB n=1 Tax=Desnuesiella massiliensis TaxID=1650662 RepID=UPI0006E17C80|nr:PTS sugar transporter subunit IIB [Desnuesiella massiliensis]